MVFVCLSHVHLSVPNCSPVAPIIPYQCTLSTCAVQVCLPVSHTPATGYVTVPQNPPYLPEVTCHTSVTGTCVTQLANFLLCDSALAISALSTVELQTLRVELKLRERHFTGPMFTQPPSTPDCFGNSLFHLSSSASEDFQASSAGPSAWPVAWCGHIPELCGSQPGVAVLPARWGLWSLSLSRASPSRCPAQPGLDLSFHTARSGLPRYLGQL